MRTQAGSYRLAISIRYWNSARIILASQIRPGEFMEPVSHLLSMAAELVLKAFLTDCGVDDKALSRKIGHDLGDALRFAIQRGLAISELEATAVLSMRESHLSHFNRYGPKAVAGNLQLGAFLQFNETLALERVAMIIDRVSGDPKALRNRWQHIADLDWPATLPLLAWIDLKRLEVLEGHARAEVERVAALNAQFVIMGVPGR